jgi:hypothetical protein
MNEPKNENTKVGAVILKKPIPASHLFEYEAVLFITAIPLNVTDEILKQSLHQYINKNYSSKGIECIVRADINATSNEIYEQFKGLNNDAHKVASVNYASISSLVS